MSLKFSVSEHVWIRANFWWCPQYFQYPIYKYAFCYVRRAWFSVRPRKRCFFLPWWIIWLQFWGLLLQHWRSSVAGDIMFNIADRLLSFPVVSVHWPALKTFPHLVQKENSYIKLPGTVILSCPNATQLLDSPGCPSSSSLTPHYITCALHHQGFREPWQILRIRMPLLKLTF